MTLFEQAMGGKRTHDARDLLDEMTDAEQALESALAELERNYSPSHPATPGTGNLLNAWRRLKAARLAVL